MEDSVHDPLGGLDALFDAAGADDVGADAACVDEDDLPILHDDTEHHPWASAVNPRKCAFAFMRPSTSFDDLIVGLQTLVVGSSTLASPTQRSLASEKRRHLGRLQRAAAAPPLPFSVQAEAHAAAIIGPGQIPPSLGAALSTPLSTRQVASLQTSALSGIDVPPRFVTRGGADASQPPQPPSSSAPPSRSPRPLPPRAPAELSSVGSPQRARSPPPPSSSSLPQARAGYQPLSPARPTASPDFLRRLPQSNATTEKRTAVAQAHGVNHVLIKLPRFDKDFEVMLEQIRDFWTKKQPLMPVALQQLVAGSATRATLKQQQVIAPKDSTKLSKYKAVASEASFMGGWDQLFECLREEKRRWDVAAAAAPRAAGSRKPRSFRWSEIVEFVVKRAANREK